MTTLATIAMAAIVALGLVAFILGRVRAYRNRKALAEWMEFLGEE